MRGNVNEFNYSFDISTRECGIASFSNDLKTNLELWGQNVSILAMNDNGSYKYPQEVVFELNEDSRDDYLISAQFVNTADIDAVFIEHEYGIFWRSRW